MLCKKSCTLLPLFSHEERERGLQVKTERGKEEGEGDMDWISRGWGKWRDGLAA